MGRPELGLELGRMHRQFLRGPSAARFLPWYGDHRPGIANEGKQNSPRAFREELSGARVLVSSQGLEP